jgi:class 3 adenylate cyclase/tetratricopeptide (TPR) repeat protein
MARTETVTVLFTDLVGSTELAGRLGHDAYEQLRCEHFIALRAAVAKHNGSEVKTTGDGLMLCFSSAADAVACAATLQQATEQQGRQARRPVLSPVEGPAATSVSSPSSFLDSESHSGAGVPACPPLHLRVGASSGEATRENSDLYGPPVVEAARLCAAAAAGQILVSDVVRALARGRGHTFTSVGELTLKGLPEPVVACEVKWEALAPAAGVPLPPRLAATPALGLFGRSAEQAVLAKAWSQAKEGQRHLVLLAGEPGIGKTRLAVEMARAAHADGATVLFGFCDEDVTLPYRPFVEALRHYVAHAPDDVLAAHVRAHQGELARLVPELRARVTDLPAPQVAEAETERYLLFEAVAGLLGAASQDAPIVLVFDDLHWAGAPELLLLKHIIRSAEPMRLLIIASYRDTDLTRTHPLTSMLADLRRESGVERLALRGLDDAAVVALVQAAAGHDLPEAGIALAHALHHETEGSPFFITEILRNLSESGAVVHEGERWTYKGDIAALGIPEGVKDVIGRRLGRLSEATNKVLSLAAVIGRQFDLALLTRVATGIVGCAPRTEGAGVGSGEDGAQSAPYDRDIASEDAILDALDEATAAALVAEVPGEPEHYSFSHALIRTTLYEELSSARRARLHRKVGEALEALAGATPGARIDELAHHWLAAAQVADAAKAIGYARQAGDRALTGLAYEAAAAHYERALAVLEATDRDGELLRCDLLLALGAAQRNAGDTRFRETMTGAAALARRHGDAHRLGVAALGSGLPGAINAVDDTLVDLYAEAAAALGPSDNVLRARVLSQLAVELLGTSERDRRHALSAEALEIARRTGDRLGLANVLIARVRAINDPTTLAERLALSAELEALANDLGNLDLSQRAVYRRAGVLMESGDPVGAARALARCEQLAVQLHVPFFNYDARAARAGWSLMCGSPDAEQQALSACELGTSFGLPLAGDHLGLQLGEIRYRQGRCAEIADAVRAYAEAMPNNFGARVLAAFCYCESDLVDQAKEQFAQFAATGFDLPLGPNWAGSMFLLAEVCGALRDARAAELLYAKLRPLAEQVGVVGGLARCDGSLGHPAGVLAACMQHWEDAERHFEHAVAMNDRLGARPAAVRTRRAYAAMLLDRNAPGDQQRATALITAALAETEQLDMPAEAAKLQRLRERLG